MKMVHANAETKRTRTIAKWAVSVNEVYQVNISELFANKLAIFISYTQPHTYTHTQRK